ncbi:unnamed protein product [Urochloa decumbens]|uniref:DUF676 domain-containing protein n=1 Tax=Urochloa decumbens TaxID=240449 RepID=A0ABC9EH76_9POAL
MPASSRFYTSATCSLASASSRSPPHRRHASVMGQSPSAPPARSRSRRRSSSHPGLGLDLGFLLGRKPRPGDERLDLANWMRCFLSQRLPPPSAEAEADAEGKAAGSCEEHEVGGEEANHLVVMVNGLYGSSEDWKFAAEQFVKRLPGKVFVHRSQSNHSKLTYDGVDLMGERLAEELPFLFGVPLLERTAAGAAHFIVGRTGKHLFLTDRDDGKPPLLVRMVEDCDDGKFMSALRSFKRRVAYANVTYDHIVGWRTSSIRRQHELPKLKLSANDEKYPHVINVDKGNSEDRQQEESVEASLADSLEERMIRGLTQVSWERVDVCFHKSWLRYNAHNNIQVRIHPVNSDGEDVIYHMIDNFLV